MQRNNRITASRLVRNGGRLIHQLLRLADLLETRRLAEALEIGLDVSRATVYRYLECLTILGVPASKRLVNGCVFYSLPQPELVIVQIARVLLAHVDRRLLRAIADSKLAISPNADARDIATVVPITPRVNVIGVHSP